MELESDKLLRAAQENLRRAIKLSGQGSYERRQPAPESLPHYQAAKQIVGRLLDDEPNNRASLVTMSKIQEGLMDFGGAEASLVAAIEEGERRTKRTMKRLARLADSAKKWRDIMLSPSQLRELGEYLESMQVSPVNNTLELTRRWIAMHVDRETDDVIQALEQRGAFSDFQVLVNVVYG